MLGDLISEGVGKRGTRRVIAVEPKLQVEVSFEAPTRVLGRPGGELATWKGIANGHYLPDGAVSYRGAITFSSSTPTLSKLNAVAGVFEFEVSADGTTRSRIWEWK